jgi:hypothetical protein
MAEKNNAEVVQLKKIQRELIDIKKQNTISYGWLLRGILQGVGAIIGSAIAVVALSWILSVLGIIPGFGQIAAYLGDVFSKLPR